MAYVALVGDGDKLKVMFPDGSGIRSVGEPGVRYDLGFDWSTDGRWIVAKQLYPGIQRLAFINVATGLSLPVYPNSDWFILSPAWRP